MDLGSGRRGVDMGPSAIRIAGLSSELRHLGHRVIDEGDFDIRNMEELQVGDIRARYLAEITQANRELADKVRRVIRRGHFPLVLGGDHSIAVGTVSGVAAARRRRGKKVGVLWVDAHSDINTPQTSPSGNVHGMPLAALLGLGPAPLGSIGGRFRKVDPDNVALVGIRSVDEGERDHLRRLGVHVYTMADIDRHGIHIVMEKAIANVTEGHRLRARELRSRRGGSQSRAGGGHTGEGRARLPRSAAGDGVAVVCRGDDVAGDGRGQPDSG